RVAGKDAFLAGDAAGHQRGILVGDLFEGVDHVEVDVPGQEVFPDALSDVRVDLVLVEDPRLFVFLEYRAVGIDDPNLDLRVALFQVPACARRGAAGPDADDQVSDAAVG